MTTDEEIGKFLKEYHDKGYTIVFSGCVGSVKAMGAAIPFWKLLEPHASNISAIRTASGSGIPLSLAASGVSANEIALKLPTVPFKDFIEDIGLFAEHNTGVHFWNHIDNVISYYVDGYYTARAIIKHLTSGTGIVTGEKLKELLAKNLKSNNFRDTHPSLEVMATRLGSSLPFTFSKNTTPDVPISEAVTASCAITEFFKTQLINGVMYVDAALAEPLPLISIVNDHVRSGKDPEKLLIIGFFVHTFPNKEPDLDKQHIFAMKKHYATAHYRKDFGRDRKMLDYQKIKNIIIELNALSVQVPIHDPFPELYELGRGFRMIRKFVAKIARKKEIERLLRGVTIFLYEEMNLAHLPYYMDAFRPVIEEKFIKRIEQFRKTYPL